MAGCDLLLSPFPPLPKAANCFCVFSLIQKLKTVCIFTEVWGCTEILPYRLLSQLQLRQDEKFKIIKSTRRGLKQEVITWAFQRKHPRHKFGFFFFFCVQSQNAVSLQCMHRMNPRAYGLKQWLPSWAIPSLMYAKEIQWLLCSIYIQSHTPFAVDPH